MSCNAVNINKKDISHNEDLIAKIRSENNENSLNKSSTNEHGSTQITARKKLDLTDNNIKLKETFKSSSEKIKSTKNENEKNKNDHKEETCTQNQSTKKSKDSIQNESIKTASKTLFFRTPTKNNITKKLTSNQRTSSRKKNKKNNLKDQRTLSQCWNKKVR